MSKTIYIDCNRLNAIDKDSDNKAEWTFNLNNSISVPAGSAIQIQNSFINQKGIMGSSIEIEEDILETISYYVYITEELKPLPAMVDTGSIPWSDSLYTLGTNFLYSTPISGTTAGYLTNRFNMGGSQIPMILYEKIAVEDNTDPSNPVDRPYIRPKVQTKRIVIKKGVYGINQLAQLITDQINGKKTIDNVPINPQDHLLSNQSYTGNLCDIGASGVQGYNALEDLGGGAGLTATIPQYIRFGEMETATKFVAEFNNLKHDYILIDAYQHEFNLKIKKENPTTLLAMNWNQAGVPNAFNATCKGLLVDNRIEAPDAGRKAHGSKAKKSKAEFQSDIDDYMLGVKGYTIGATNFNISYDSTNNGFTINNLHQDFIIPSHDYLGFTQPNAGSIGVAFRNPALFNEDATTPTIDESDAIAKQKLYSGLRKPVSRIGGATIFNFARDTAIKFGNVNLIGVTEATQANFSFNDYFINPAEAKIAWQKTLWGRLGFSYEQLNDSKHMEEITSMNKSFKGHIAPTSFGFKRNEIMKDGLKMTGITTDAETDISIIPTISTLTNPNVVATDGEIDAFENVKTYSGNGSNTPRRIMRGQQGTNDNIASYRGSPYSASTTDLIVTTPKPIIAELLPTLSIFGYYLISSNIVAENDDIVQKGSPIPLLGVVPKSSLSSQDFISSENDIVHITTQQQVINNIKMSVFNPDLTQPQLDGASSIIVKITMPIPQPEPVKEDKKK
tara:strand:+ start:24 stop:2216 length:2193 start_codon:yes stop_codon:yes gene_type:complete